MIKIGMILGDRYEILEKIGTGGMSDVYKAKDHKLNRFIAVKVLKQEFSENNNFVSKFKSEAQAAAGLMHPNIVNVYDVGAEDGIYYIVMELVEGITLKKYIEKKIRLSSKEAISIAIQVSNGIAAAHNNHIIHRDIKPQNIIISKEGKVKVTDFGIAKAATNNTVSSNVMGSVHYTSPEQARGGFSDERSDIYSLGITMFEMLTGRVPFNGDTTVAIAIKHIQEPLPYPSDYAPDIPISVESIVIKCCQKSPDRRYQSMDELIADLKQSLITPDEDFVKIIDPDVAAATRTVTEDERASIKSSLNTNGEGSHSGIRLKNADENDYRKSTGKGTRSDSDDYPRKNSGNSRNSGTDKGNGGRNTRNDDRRKSGRYEEPENNKYSKSEKVTTILVIVAAVLIGLIIIFLIGRVAGVFGGGNDTQTEESAEGMVTMPDVVGLKSEDAKKQLLDVGLTPCPEYKVTTEYDEDTVVETSVAAGESVQAGSDVVITIAQKNEGVEVPSVVGVSQAEAKSTLEQHGFTVKVLEAENASVEKGYTISQSPEGETYAPAGSEIMITISTGGDESSDNVSVPNVIGMSEMDARVTLVEQGFQVGEVSEENYEDTGLEGLVCYQSLSAGSYAGRGATIDLHVSIGPKGATYKYSGAITAPTEDPDYVNGMSVNVTVTSDDGKQLLSTTTTSFPLDFNVSGVTSPTGKVTFFFTVSKEASTYTDETGATVTEEADTYDKSVERQITFEAE